MPKTISASDLRAQIKRVINEVSYGQADYVVEKFGEPTAAIINVEDYRLLQSIKQEQAVSSVREVLTRVRGQNREVDADDLDELIEKARDEFYRLRSERDNAG